MRWAWWLLGGISVLVGCAETGDYTPQIHVTAGAAARVLWIESHRPRVAQPSHAQAAAREGGQEGEDTPAADGDENADAGEPDGG